MNTIITIFSELKKNVGWSERRCTVSLHELLVWFRHIGKEKERWLSEAQTTQHCQSIFILLLPRKKSFRFVYTVRLAKMYKTQNVCWKASIKFKFLRLLNLQSPFIERLNNLSCPESYIPFTMRQFKIRITYRLKTAITTSNIAPGTKIIDNFETTGPIIHRSHLDHPTIFELLPFLEKSLITICFLQLP